jgi:anti-sigma-K factor RskA
MRNSQKERDYIRQYVLGTHDRENEQWFEQRLLSDAKLLQELSIIENEVLYEYVSGILSESERKAFESRFPTTSQAQVKVQFFNTLKKQINNLNVNADYNRLPSSWKRFLPSFLRGESPVLRITFATASLLVVFGGAFAIFESRRQLKREPAVFAVTLSQSPVRDLDDSEINIVKVPDAIDVVELQVEVSTKSGEDFRALLFTDQGAGIYSEGNLKAESITTGRVVKVRVPSAILTRGDYRLNIQSRASAGNFDEVGTYSFRVVRQ